MKKATTIIFIGLLFVMSGCIPSVHPLYTEQDLIVDPALAGTWMDKDGKEAWTFTKSGEKQYNMLYVDEKGKKGDFVVHLFTVGDRKFLDLYPDNPDLQQNDFFKCHLLPVHTFMRVRQEGDSLQMAFLKLNWLKDLLRENANAVKHEKVDDGILLTAQPKDLQAFLIKHDKTPDAWEERSPMTRGAEKAK